MLCHLKEGDNAGGVALRDGKRCMWPFQGRNGGSVGIHLLGQLFLLGSLAYPNFDVPPGFVWQRSSRVSASSRFVLGLIRPPPE